MQWSRRAIVIIGALALVGVAAGVIGAPSASSQALTLRAVRVAEQPEVDPGWRVWAKVPGVDVPITAQNITYPMGGGSVPAVSLKAIHYNGVLYIRATWKDTTEDAAALDVSAFTDAAALEFPATSAVSVPSFCMGQANAGVNIWQWRADSQAGGPDRLRATLQPNAHSDGYPAAFENDPIYQPARALGNPVALGGDSPVQNLVAQAFGTLSPAADQAVTGKGAWRNGEWSVVFTRPFTSTAADQATFAEGTATSMAVAVWNGSQGDRAGQKTVSQFVTLSLGGAALKEGAGRDWGAVWLALVIGGGAVLAGLAILGMTAMAGGQRRS